MSTIASLIATLGLDVSGFNKGADDAEKRAGGLSKGLSGFQTASLVGATSAVVALGGGLASSVSVAANFEKQMDAVGAVSGASESEMGQLGKTALRIGEETAFGAQEMGGAMEILAGSGMSATQIINGAADATAALAAAGGTDLATAAGVASTAMGVWGLEADQLTDVVNRVAGAANVSKFGVEDMAGAMAMGGGAASAAGVDFADFSTVIGSTAKYFSSGSDAGTSFKTFLTRLAAPTDKAASAMEELGINVFDSEGNMKSMGDIAGILQSSMGSLSEEQKAQALATIFGADASRTAIGLMETGSEEFQRMSDVMKNTDATAVAAQRMDNFSGAMDQVKGAIETLQIKIGSALLPILTTLAMWLAEKIPAAATAVADGFQLLMDKTEPVRAAISTFATTVATEVMPHLQAFADWFTGNSEAMTAAGVAVGSILVAAFLALGLAAAGAAVSVLIALAPILAVAAAAAVLGLGIWALIKYWDEIVKAFPAAAVALDMVKEGWQNFLSWLTGTFIPRITGIADAFQEAGSRALGFAKGHWEEIQTVIDGVLMFIVTQVGNVFTMIGGIIDGALQVVSGIIKTFTGLLSGDWEMAWEGIKEIANGVWTTIVALVTFHIDTLTNIVTNLGPALVAILSMAWDLLKNVTQAAWDGIKAGVSAAVDALPGLISAAGGALQSAASAAWDAVKSAVSAAWGAIKGLVTSAVQAIPGLISAGAGLLADAGKAAFEALKSGVEAVWDAIAAWVPTLPGIAAGLIVAGVGLLMDAGQQLLTNMWEGAKAVWETVSSWAGTLPGLAKAAIVAGVGLLMEAGKNLIDNMKTGLASAFVDVKAYVATFPGKMVEALGDLGGILLGAGKAIAGGLKDGLVAGFEAVKGEVSSWGGKIASLKGPESYDKALLVNQGNWIAEGLTSGLAEGFDGQVAPEVATWGAKIAEGIDSASPAIEESVEGIKADIANMFNAIVDEGLEFGFIIDGVSDALTDFGYAGTDVARNMEYLMDAMEHVFRMAESGSITMEQAVSWAFDSVQEIMTGSQLTAEQWAAEFAKSPVEAAAAFNELHDSVRYGIGGMLEAMGGFGLASRGLLEDFSFNLEAIPLSMEEVRANIQANFATWGGTFATEMQHGGRMVGEELQAMLDSLTASIESANLSEQASAEAFAMLDKMASTIESNEGTVTHGVDKMLRRIGDLITDPANVETAAAGTKAIVDAMYYSMQNGWETKLVPSVAGWPADLAARFREGSEAALPIYEGALLDTARAMSDTWASAAQGFGRDATDDLVVWQNVLVEGISTGRTLADSELTLMMNMIAQQIGDMRYDLPLETAAAIDETFAAMVASMQSGGGVASSEMLSVLNMLLGHVATYTDGLVEETVAGHDTWQHTLEARMDDIADVVSDRWTAIDAVTEDGVRNWYDIFTGGTEDTMSAIQEILTTATPLIATAGADVAGAAIEGFESMRLADELAKKTRDAMLLTEAEILIAKPAVTTATADLGTSAVEGWQQVDFGTWLVNTINANMAAAKAAIDTARPILEGAMTTTGTDVGNGLVSGISATQPNVQAIINAMGMLAINTMRTTVQSHSDSKVFFSVGTDIGNGLASGITASTPTVQAAITGLATQMITTGTQLGINVGTVSGETTITSTINAIQNGSADLEAAWADIEARMKTINDDAATSGGASYAQRWYKSMVDGMESGMVSAATAVEIMTGVLYNAANPFASGTASPQTADWAKYFEHMNDWMYENNTEMFPSHGPRTESTDGIGQTNDYWARLSRAIQEAREAAGISDRLNKDKEKATDPSKYSKTPIEIKDIIPEMSVLDKAVSEMIADGVLDMADVLSARKGGFDLLADAIMASLAGMFDASDLVKLKSLGIGEDVMAALMQAILAAPVEIPSDGDNAYLPGDDDATMWKPGPEDSAYLPGDDDETMWVPSDEDQNAFSETNGNTYITIPIAGYYNGADSLLRDLNQAAVQAGAPPLIPTP